MAQFSALRVIARIALRLVLWGIAAFAGFLGLAIFMPTTSLHMLFLLLLPFGIFWIIISVISDELQANYASDVQSLKIWSREHNRPLTPEEIQQLPLYRQHTEWHSLKKLWQLLRGNAKTD